MSLVDRGTAAEWVRIADLVPWKKNPRKNDEAVAHVAESIRVFGFGSPVLARKANREIIAGHTRIRAAKQLGMTEVPCRYLDIDEEKAHLLAIADNKLNEVAVWDDALLGAVLADLKLTHPALDLSVTGFADGELEKLLAPAASDTTASENDLPELPTDPVTRRGDLWHLGANQILCGDALSAADVARLLGPTRINIAFTSPAYASQRKYDESSGFKPIAPDHFVEWFEAVQQNVGAHLAPDGSWFVNIKPASSGLDTELYVHDLVLAHARRWGWHFAGEFCWERTGIPGKPMRRFKNQFEPVFHFAKAEWRFRPRSVRHASDGVFGYSPSNALSHGVKHSQGMSAKLEERELVEDGLAYPGNRLPPFAHNAVVGHAAVFPVGLPEFFLKAYSDPGDVVFDPFMGSGTTLIAAEKTGRKAYGIEISPAYVDLIVARWQNFTGRKAERR